MRKLKIGLASTLIGISLLGYAQPIRVRADETENPSDKSNVIFGRIIPVNEDGNAIANAPHPQYRHDPNDPDQAIATPAPKIKGYQVKKSKNYDQDNNLVTPPADPREDTRLTYKSQTSTNKPGKKTKESRRSKTRIFEFMKQSKNASQASEQENNKNVNSNVKPTLQSLTPETSQTSQNSENNANTNAASSAFSSETTDYSNSNTAEIFSESKSDKSLASSSENLQKSDEGSKKNEEKKEKKLDKKEIKKTREDKKETDSSNKNSKPKKNPKKRIDQFPETPKVIMPEKVKIPPKTLKATIKIVDHDRDDTVLTEQTLEGKKGDRIVFDNLKQSIEIYNYSGYKFEKIINVTSDVDMKISDIDHIELGVFADEDLTFNVEMVHKKVKVTPQNCSRYNVNPDQVKYITTLTVQYSGAGKEDPRTQVEKAIWSRTLTADEVTGELIKGEFDTDFKPNIKIYPEVKTPEIAGFKADKEVISNIKVEKENIKKRVEYTELESKKAKEVTQELNDKEETPEQITQKDIDSARDLINEAQGILASLGISSDTDIKQDSKQEKKIDKKDDIQNESLDSDDLLKPVESKIEFSKQTSEKEETNTKKTDFDEKVASQVKENKLKLAKPDEEPQETSKVQIPAIAATHEIKKEPEVKTPVVQPTESKKKIKPVAQISKTNNEKQEIKIQADGETKTFIQTIHFVDENGKKLHKDKVEVLAFVKSEAGWNKPVDTFATVTAPVIDTYFSEVKLIFGKTVMPDEKDLRSEINVIYRKMAQVIPVDINGKIIENSENKPTSQQFINDPHNASMAKADQEVPVIAGYSPTVKTITPVNPGVNIPVVYNVEI